VYSAGSYLTFDLTKWELGHRSFLFVAPGEMVEIKHNDCDAWKWLKKS